MKIRFFPVLAFFLSAAELTTASLSYNVSATQNGVPLDPSDTILKESPPIWHATNHSLPTKGVRPRATTGTTPNWCGVYQPATSDVYFTSVYGAFQVPTISVRDGSTASQTAGIWVGLGGAGSQVILQAGFGATVQGSSTTYWVWWQWYPEAMITISSFSVNPGDWMSVSVVTTSSSSGTIIITNLSQGIVNTIAISGGPALVSPSADWILEAPFLAGDCPDFSTAWFEQTAATKNDLTTYGLDGGVYLSMQDSGTAVMCTPNAYDTTDFYFDDNDD